MVAEKPEVRHFNQKPRRKAEFIKPINVLKSKAGYGGLDEDILSKAQALLENNSADFQPLAEIYLSGVMRGIEGARNQAAGEDGETLVTAMLYPAMQLKATHEGALLKGTCPAKRDGGGMFGYPLVTRIADKLIQFLEVIAAPDGDAIEIVLGFHTIIRAVLMDRVTGSGGPVPLLRDYSSLDARLRARGDELCWRSKPPAWAISSIIPTTAPAGKVPVALAGWAHRCWIGDRAY